ncbi:MAG TPA: glycosyltransferase family 87 protein [Candidatus Angelobacter sp.]|nr:glycosyltransferase family 87 protein [Candidatus Angelobacter sp.]
MGKAKQAILYLMLLCAGLSVAWGFLLNRGTPGGIMGFPGIYYGTKCLVHGCDPYNPRELQAYFQAQTPQGSAESLERRQSVTLYVNLPPTFLFVAPFVALPLKAAQFLWGLLIVGCFVLGSYLIWSIAASDAPALSAVLVCIVLANSEIIFAGGNTAGFVISLCLIAVWCLTKERFALVGIACFAVSLTMKPHDGGLVWLYFLLAGGVYRKRALQTLALAIALVAVSFLWVSHAAPHWPAELRANLHTISAPNGINDPGPRSIGVNSPDMIIDLQTVISIPWERTTAYNTITYILCGIPLLLWIFAAVRSRMTQETTWLALAVAAPLSMLFTYHRSYDAKLVLLCLPACAALWKSHDRRGWTAGVLLAATVVMIGDIPMALLVFSLRHWQLTPSTLGGKLAMVAFARPTPILLFLLMAFFLWMQITHVRRRNATRPE